ncbi:hypothetical protein [Mucilaginibacter paludis]|uniref:Ankyrin n=1 Tax=Mucilaginibacter paludis DSM 18603 TaxID=714943 RepID=H1YCI8_9SPHI|nr:hypothetical protein [Mucilaginibacter paludis]EHQ30666.1 hypothetical protein Mucpa_6615 [Mucilaginibacter paludis DSM 18603]
MLPKPLYFDDAIWGTQTWPLLNAAHEGDVQTVTSIVKEDDSRVKSQFAYYDHCIML